MPVYWRVSGTGEPEEAAYNGGRAGHAVHAGRDSWHRCGSVADSMDPPLHCSRYRVDTCFSSCHSQYWAAIFECRPHSEGTLWCAWQARQNRIALLSLWLLACSKLSGSLRASVECLVRFLFLLPSYLHVISAQKPFHLWAHALDAEFMLIEEFGMQQEAHCWQASGRG